MPESWLVSCTFRRTWCLVWIALVGWWRRPSISLQVWWGHCCISIIRQIWWKSTILVICQWGWRWGKEGRCSWWCGYWDTDSLDGVVIFQLLSFSWRRRELLKGISRGRFSLSWDVLRWTPCRLDVWWSWVGKPWLVGVWTSPWVQWCGHMVERVAILWGFSWRICLCIPWRLLIRWPSLWRLLEQWLLILLFIWLWTPVHNCLHWRTWHVVPVSKSWKCCIAHPRCELLHHVAYTIGGITVPILCVVLLLLIYS